MIDTSTSLAQARRMVEGRGFTPHRTVDPEASPEGEITRPNDLYGIGADMVVHLKMAGDYLERVYPGWLWALNPNPKGQVVNLLSMRLHPNYGFTIHADKFCDDYANVYVKWAAGELLERFGMPRKPFRMCHQELVNAKRDPQGNVVPDLSGVRKGRIKGFNKEYVINEKIRTGELVEQNIGGARILVKTRNFNA